MRFSTIAPVKAGWLLKSKGQWFLTEEAKQAARNKLTGVFGANQSNGPNDFFRSRLAFGPGSIQFPEQGLLGKRSRSKLVLESATGIS